MPSPAAQSQPPTAISLTASLPAPLWEIVRALRGGVSLIILTGDVNEVFTQNYRYQSILDWLREAVRDLVVHYIADNSLANIKELFQKYEKHPLMLLNPEILFAEKEASVLALIKARVQGLAKASGHPHLAERRADSEDFDPAEFLERVGGDLELGRELIRAFLETIPGQMAELGRALKEGNVSNCHRLAHSIGGAVGMFGQGPAWHALQRLEMMGREGDLSGAHAAWRTLEDAVARFRRALESGPADRTSLPLLLVFGLPSSIPEELYSPLLNSVFIHVSRLKTDNPGQLLAHYLEEQKMAIALDEVKPALKGLSNQDILYCLDRITRAGRPITAQSVLAQKLNLLRARYSRLGAAHLATTRVDDLLVQPALRRFLRQLAKRAQTTTTARIRRTASYGAQVTPVMEAFACDLGLVALQVESLSRDTLAETRRTLDQLEDLIFSQPGCVVFLAPFELIVPSDTQAVRGAGAQLVQKRFLEILDRMGGTEDTACLFVGTRHPSRLGLELNLRFTMRVPVLPVLSATAVLQTLRDLAGRRGLDLPGLPPPETEVCLLTPLHFEGLLGEVARRVEAGEPLDAGVWASLPPAADLHDVAQDAAHWANVNLEETPS